MPSDRDYTRLTGVHPKVVTAVLSILSTFPMFVVMGLRTTTEQHTLYLQGRDPLHPGPIVTYKDGYVHLSNHQAHSDGLGHAVDCAWLGGDPFAETHDWPAYGAAVRAAGLTWGGDWHMADRPHAELP